MITTQKIIRVGNSQAITIPKKIQDHLKTDVGDLMEIDFRNLIKTEEKQNEHK